MYYIFTVTLLRVLHSLFYAVSAGSRCSWRLSRRQTPGSIVTFLPLSELQQPLTTQNVPLVPCDCPHFQDELSRGRLHRLVRLVGCLRPHQRPQCDPSFVVATRSNLQETESSSPSWR
ncbi:hypothetical protein BYT27DRAFT_6698274 [Phlegmacium glaucopus]|nr:hypothetical protein BYT27DRAFT_6698274 [Phlegmacium glaucopus]